MTKLITRQIAQFICISLLIMTGCTATAKDTPSATPTVRTPLTTATPTLMATPTPPPTARATLTPLSPATTTPVPRWVEYEAMLARALLPGGISGLCEWEILGQQEREVYVWTLCVDKSPYGNSSMSASAPAVIYLDTDGNVQSVRVPRDGTLYGQDVKTFFPPDVQSKVFAHQSAPGVGAHINKRLADSSVPPLIVVSGTPMPSVPLPD